MKSFFGLHKVPWLGQIVNEDGVRPHPAKTEVIADWPRPQNMKEMQSFLGFAQLVQAVHRRILTAYGSADEAHTEEPDIQLDAGM